jgi:hypothetical protein
LNGGAGRISDDAGDFGKWLLRVDLNDEDQAQQYRPALSDSRTPHAWSCSVSHWQKGTVR